MTPKVTKIVKLGPGRYRGTVKIDRFTVVCESNNTNVTVENPETLPSHIVRRSINAFTDELWNPTGIPIGIIGRSVLGPW